MHKYFRIINKVISLTGYNPILIFLLFMINGILELISIYSIYPFLSVILNESILENNLYLVFIKDYLNIENEILILILGIVSIFSLILVNSYFIFSHHFITKLTNLFNVELSFLVLKKNLSDDYLGVIDKNSSDIISNVNIETQRFSQGFVLSMLNVISRLIVILILFILVILRNPLLIISAILIFLITYFLLFKVVLKNLVHFGKKSSQDLFERLNFTKESLINLKYLIIKNQINIYLNKFKKVTIGYYKSEYFRAVIAIIPRYFIETIFFIFVIISLLIFRNLNSNPPYLLTELVFFAIISYRLLPNLQQVYANFTNMKYHENLFELFSEHLFSTNLKNKNSIQKIDFLECIRIENVSFKYPSSKTLIFKDFSLKIKKNNLTILKGKSGTGKTTLVDLITGLFPPNQGQVYIDEVNVHLLDNHSRSKLFSLQTQNIVLVNDTLKNNFYLGSDKAINKKNDLYLDELIGFFNLNSFINKLENGIDTMISEDGNNISGGEKQRIGLVRSFFSQSFIIILDEPTNNLDAVSIEYLIKALNLLKQKHTIIIITHAESADLFKISDEIVKL